MNIKQNSAIGISLVAIWLSVLLTSLLAPDMITGSQQEHIPIVAMTGWAWGILATGLVACLAFVSKVQKNQSAWATLLMVTVMIWASVALIGIFSNSFVTGTDPTQIPLAGLIAPIIGTLATAFVCLFTAISQTR